MNTVKITITDKTIDVEFHGSGLIPMESYPMDDGATAMVNKVITDAAEWCSRRSTPKEPAQCGICDSVHHSTLNCNVSQF